MKLYEAAYITRKNGMSINVEWIVEFCRKVRNGLCRMVESTKAFLLRLWKALNANKVLIDKINSKKRHKRYKLDLTRIKIQHQVTCRKPKYLIKKII